MLQNGNNIHVILLNNKSLAPKRKIVVDYSQIDSKGKEVICAG